MARAEKRKQTHMSPGTRFNILDFLSDDVLIYMAKSCGVTLEGYLGSKGLGYCEPWCVVRQDLIPALGVQ